MTIAPHDRTALAATLRREDRVRLEGVHAVKHALRFGASLDLLATDDPGRLARLVAELAPDLADRFASATVLPAGTLRELLPRLASPCVGVAHPWSLPDPQGWRAAAPVVVLERPRHRGNVGAVLRVAAAADAAGVVLVGGPSPRAPDVVRAAAGLVFAVPTAAVDDVARLRALAGRLRRPLIGLDASGDAPVPAPEHRSDDAADVAPMLVFGTERGGLSDAMRAACDATWRLPMRADVSSLNLATAVSATLYLRGAPFAREG